MTDSERNMLRTGIGYNIKLLQKNNPELYDKYKMLFAFFDTEVVYQNELVQISRTTAHEFFLERHPHIKALQEGKMTMEEAMEWVRKNVTITIEE